MSQEDLFKLIWVEEFDFCPKTLFSFWQNNNDWLHILAISIFQIVNYDGKGRGIQAMKSFSKGDFIVEYAGDLVELSEAKSREEIYKKDTSYGCYMYFFNHKGRSYW